MDDQAPAKKLIKDGPCVVNIGIRDFAESLVQVDNPVIHVKWRPPVQLKPDVQDALRLLLGEGTDHKD